MRGHGIAWASNPTTVLEKVLPRAPNTLPEHLRVVISKPCTPAQVEQAKQSYKVSRTNVRQLMTFYKDNNNYYRDVQINQASMESIPQAAYLVPGILMEPTEEAPSAQQVDEDRSSFTEAPNHNNVPADEETEVREQVSMMSSDVESPNLLQQVREMLAANSNYPTLAVQPSTSLFKQNNVSLIFSHLFCCGTGGPNYKREIAVSVEQCILHYMLVSSRHFAEDELFLLFCVDLLSRQKAYKSVSLYGMISGNDFADLATVSVAELDSALKHEEENHRRALEGRRKFSLNCLYPTNNTTHRRSQSVMLFHQASQSCRLPLISALQEAC